MQPEVRICLSICGGFLDRQTSVQATELVIARLWEDKHTAHGECKCFHMGLIFLQDCHSQMSDRVRPHAGAAPRSQMRTSPSLKKENKADEGCL